MSTTPVPAGSPESVRRPPADGGAVVAGDLAADLVRRLADTPDVRADVVAGARARLQVGPAPTDHDVAGAVVDDLVGPTPG